ncbi:hypothetical protein PFICI_02945 [Pestalotiopsis fici W106-1]|uniref:Uncharacterized protein n=1 Tax=Pestalotiopsis fici (strain W106-1 / CGMCC3.15140) TaxID=1229662 RepID=W3XFW0_PESFW|nr:uncharacterized protein PFICI_02945 [Pestalotiopsis fici W106-1]ETS84920.1 hypothetical protein PFICI_02945 [Pestalotiopsis fici W106-1]
MSSLVPANGQQAYIGLGYLSPELCWEHLQVQLSPFTQVIAIDARDYDAWTQDTRNILVQMFMHHARTHDARYVRDAAGGRVFLGAVEHLTTEHVVVLNIPGSDLPVMLPRASIWAGPNSTNNAQNQYSFTPSPPQNHQQQVHQQMVNQFGTPPSYSMPAMMPMGTGMQMNVPISTAPISTPAAPKTPEQQEETPTKAPSSRKRKSTTKTPGSRKRNTSNVRIKKSDSDDGEDKNNSSPSGNKVKVNLVQVPELNTALAKGEEGQAAKD